LACDLLLLLARKKFKHPIGRSFPFQMGKASAGAFQLFRKDALAV
jgi:hypothetical protein